MVSCKFIVLVHERHHFVKDETKGKMSHTENKIISMLKSLLITHLSSSEDTFQQIIGTQMETKCAPLLADLFLYSYEAEILQRLTKDSKITEAKTFNLTFRYIYDVLTINKKIANWMDFIYIQ
jgi:hypothetical protein